MLRRISKVTNYHLSRIFASRYILFPGVLRLSFLEAFVIAISKSMMDGEHYGYTAGIVNVRNLDIFM